MQDFLAKTFYGNSVGEWAVAVLIIIAVLLAGKVLYWMFKGILNQLTKRTKTKLDDLILDMIEEPVVLCVSLLGIWYGLRTLTFTPKIETLITNSLQFVVVLTITWLVARLINCVFTHYLAPLAEASENDLDDQLLPILRKGTSTGIWAIGVVVALNNAGYDVGAVLAGLGIGGIALAMAAKDTISNIFGGFTIFTDRPFTIKDRVRVSGFDGNIEEIGIRSTRLRTLDGTLVTIPNSDFTASAVENVSAEPARKIKLNLGLTYDTNAEELEKAMVILKEICAGNDGVEENVSVGFNAFGDFALNILLIYYIAKEADILLTQTEVNLAIMRRFGDEKLEMAFPTQTIYTIKGD